MPWQEFRNDCTQNNPPCNKFPHWPYHAGLAAGLWWWAACHQQVWDQPGRRSAAFPPDSSRTAEHVALHSNCGAHDCVPPPAAGWSSPPGRTQPGTKKNVGTTFSTPGLHKNEDSVWAPSPPLTEASVQWLPFLAMHLPQQPALYVTTVRKIKNQISGRSNIKNNTTERLCVQPLDPPSRCTLCVLAHWRAHSWRSPALFECVRRSQAAAVRACPDWSRWCPAHSAASCALIAWNEDKMSKRQNQYVCITACMLIVFILSYIWSKYLESWNKPLDTVSKCRKPLTDLVSSSMPDSPSAKTKINTRYVGWCINELCCVVMVFGSLSLKQQPLTIKGQISLSCFTKCLSFQMCAHHGELNKFRQDIPVCWVCGWSSNRRLTRRCVCERWRLSEVTLSSIAAVFMSQDIWDRAAIWLPDESRKKNRDNDKRWQCSL